jgi:hypothetical protein
MLFESLAPLVIVVNATPIKPSLLKLGLDGSSNVFAAVIVAANS